MVNLHIIPTVTQDVTRDYVMLVPVENDETTDTTLDYMEACRVSPAVVEREIVFDALPLYRRLYDDVIVHRLPF